MSRRILFITALQEELDPLWHDDLGWSELQEHGDAIWYRRCILDKYELISACAGEVGLTAITILLTKLILRWKPLLVVMVGICAGRRDAGLELADVVISSATFHYQAGHFHLGRFEPQKRYAKPTDPILALVGQFLSTQPNEDFWRSFGGMIPRIPRILVGPYASADLVLKDADKLQEAVRSNTDLLALEMESHSVLHTAAHFGVQFGGLVIKAVSDHGDKSKSKANREFVKFAAVRTAVEFVRKAMCQLHPLDEPTMASMVDRLQDCNQPISEEKSCILLLCGDQETLKYLTTRAEDSWQTIDSSAGSNEPVFQRHIGKTIIVATCMHRGGSGVIDGALRATQLFVDIRPALGIMLGTCGGFSSRTQIGDIIIANRAFHYQFGAYQNGELDPEIRSVDINDRLRGFLSALSDTAFQAMLLQAHGAFAPAGHARPGHIPRWHFHPIGSSDLFLKDADKVGEIIALDRKVAAVDMEGYSFMRAAQHCGLEFGGLVIRSVGDYADNPPDMAKHDHYARQVAASFMADLLPHLAMLVSKGRISPDLLRTRSLPLP